LLIPGIIMENRRLYAGGLDACFVRVAMPTLTVRRSWLIVLLVVLYVCLPPPHLENRWRRWRCSGAGLVVPDNRTPGVPGWRRIAGTFAAVLQCGVLLVALPGWWLLLLIAVLAPRCCCWLAFWSFLWVARRCRYRERCWLPCRCSARYCHWAWVDCSPTLSVLLI